MAFPLTNGRRWLQWSLRSLLVLIFACAAAVFARVGGEGAERGAYQRSSAADCGAHSLVTFRMLPASGQRCQWNNERKMRRQVCNQLQVVGHELAFFSLGERYVQAVVKSAAELREDVHRPCQQRLVRV